MWLGGDCSTKFIFFSLVYSVVGQKRVSLPRYARLCPVSFTRSEHLLNFFLFPFCKKSLICLEGKSMTPLRETLFSSVPPSNSLVSISDLQRAFWADTTPFSGPRLASCVASGTTEIQGRNQVWRARRGGPRTPSTTTDANLDCAFVENALF